MHVHFSGLYVINDKCAEKHIADKSKVHIIVSLKQFLAAPKCPDHPNKQCELHCEQCDVPKEI